MPIRILLILALLVQQFALPLAIGGERRRMRRHVVLHRRDDDQLLRGDRLGDAVRQDRGECLCRVQPADSGQAPEAPRPQDRTELSTAFVIGAAVAMVVPARPRAAHRLAPPVVRRSHNETQAILCIWRT